MTLTPPMTNIARMVDHSLEVLERDGVPSPRREGRRRSSPSDRRRVANRDPGVLRHRRDRVLLHATDDGKLAARVPSSVVAFEVDAFDADMSNGWTVVVTGRAVVAEAPTPEVPATAWTPLRSGWNIAISADAVTGWRLAR